MKNLPIFGSDTSFPDLKLSWFQEKTSFLIFKGQGQLSNMSTPLFMWPMRRHDHAFTVLTVNP